MKKLFFVLAFLFPIMVYAQTLKTDVLVIGNADAAFAAGVQSSESGVNTIILTQVDGLKLRSFRLMPENGVKKAFEKQARKSLKLADGIPLPEITNQVSSAIIKQWSDSAKLFRVINNAPYFELKRAGNGWELKLNKKESIKTKVLIVADDPQQLLMVLKLPALKPTTLKVLNYNDNSYRTTIAGALAPQSGILSLNDLLITDQENLLYIPPNNPEIGQAAGATAAFAAFYKTKTSLSILKRIQGELLSYNLSLMPFEDVKYTDSNWLSIQKIGITGIIKAEIKDGKAYFTPEKQVSYNEIKQPIRDYYYKAQIWFDDHKNVQMDLETTISMICYVGNKATVATKAELQKKWNKNYKFSSSYDLKKVLSRREFAVIINDYLKPFDEVNVDKTGRVIR